MASYNHSKLQNYVAYNDKDEVFDLDQNVWHVTDEDVQRGAGVRHLYEFPANAPAPFICSRGRDKELNYLIGIERDDHPDHSSRFGYGRCPYGYCSGHFPGKYITSTMCSVYDPQPNDMAPDRFYTEAYQGPFNYNRSQANVDYNS
jgi:hypothetical protein